MIQDTSLSTPKTAACRSLIGIGLGIRSLKKANVAMFAFVLLGVVIMIVLTVILLTSTR